jgi:hypothetical protein
MRMKLLIAALLLATPAFADVIPPIIPVYGVHADANGVVLRLPPQGSGKCMPTREMMTVAVAKNRDIATLLVARKRPQDPLECRASGPAADLRWTYSELGLDAGQPFRLANPVVAEP